MNSVRGDGDFVYACSLGSGIDVNFCGRLWLSFVWLVVVVLDVVTGDLQVAHFRPFDANATQPIVADVAAGDVNLMKVHVIEINAYAGVEVYVTVTDEYVAVSLDKVDTVPTACDHYTLKH